MKRISLCLTYPKYCRVGGFSFFICFFLLSFFVAMPLQAKSIDKTITLPVVSEQSDLPWKLTSDFLASLDNGAILEARGNVILERGEDIIKAEFARYYTATDWVFVQDKVYVKLGRDEVTAKEAEFDLTTSTGWLRDGNVFMAGPHIYFTGEYVTKHFGDRYSFINAKLTACDGPNPVWGMAAREATVEMDGYATLSHAAFQVVNKNSPSMPYLVLPAKRTRQTGLLKPDFGFSSLHGAYYTQPWFWAIDPTQDITISPSWLEKSGVMLGLEYRSHSTPNQKTWLGVDYFYDANKKLVAGNDPTQINNDYLRSNHNRYWLRGMSDGNIFSSKWAYKINIDYVSDQDFLREFQHRMTGYNNTRKATFNLFGRDFAEFERDRISEAFLYRDWQHFRITLGMRYAQNPALGHGNLDKRYDTTVQKLPEFNAYFYPIRPFKNFPLEVEAQANATYFYRRYGTSGMRAEIFPRVTFPLDLNFATLLAKVGVRQVGYMGTTSSVTPGPLDPETDKHKDTYATIPEFEIQSFTQGSRVWQIAPENPLEASLENIGKTERTAIRHIIQPRLLYTYIPRVDQSNLPFYTQSDRILPTHEIKFSVTNLFTAKNKTVVPQQTVKNQKATSAIFETSYSEIARVKLIGGYSFEEAARTDYVDLYPRRPFQDLGLEINLNIFGLSLWNQTWFSLYGDGLTRMDLGASVPLFALSKYLKWDISYSQRNTMYDYQNIIRYASYEDVRLNKKVNLIRNYIDFTPNPSFSFSLEHLTDLRNGKTYEISVGGSYEHQCYKVSAKYTYNRDEQTYHLSLTLPGIFE